MAKKSENGDVKRVRRERKFPALSFEDALSLALAIQEHASGQRVRRLTLFEKMDQSPDGNPSRRLITASGQYGLSKGGYMAEFLELTPEGVEASDTDVPASKQLRARFKLAVDTQPPFNFLYEKMKGNKLPAKEVLADNLKESGLIEDDDIAECIDTFIVNAKFIGLLRTIAGSERLVSIEQLVDETTNTPSATAEARAVKPTGEDVAVSKTPEGGDGQDFSHVCFFVTPIGADGSEQRKHSDFMMEYIIGPAVRELGLTLVRADQLAKPGMIGKQIIEHILKARLVVADLSFHNPNVFYELCLRHTTRLPTVLVKRSVDSIPFDLNQYRTISVDTQDPYSLVPKIQTYVAEWPIKCAVRWMTRSPVTIRSLSTTQA
jgi:hypothetical protein